MHQLTLLSETCGSCSEDHELFHPAEGKLKPDLEPSALARQHIAIIYWNFSLLKRLICIIRPEKWWNPLWQALTASDTLDAAGSVWFDGYWGLSGHTVDMLVILDMAQVSIFQPAAAVYCCGAICLVRPCWLLVIRHQMGCHDPSILPSQPLTQRAREVSVTHAITLPVVSIICRKTQSHGRVVAAEQRRHTVRLWVRVHVAIMLCLHVFPMLTYCNKAPVSSRISSVQYELRWGSRAAAPNDSVHTQNRNATTAELAICNTFKKNHFTCWC